MCYGSGILSDGMSGKGVKKGTLKKGNPDWEAVLVKGKVVGYRKKWRNNVTQIIPDLEGLAKHNTAVMNSYDLIEVLLGGTMVSLPKL